MTQEVYFTKAESCNFLTYNLSLFDESIFTYRAAESRFGTR